MSAFIIIKTTVTNSHTAYILTHITHSHAVVFLVHPHKRKKRSFLIRESQTEEITGKHSRPNSILLGVNSPEPSPTPPQGPSEIPLRVQPTTYPEEGAEGNFVVTRTQSCTSHCVIMGLAFDTLTFIPAIVGQSFWHSTDSQLAQTLIVESVAS